MCTPTYGETRAAPHEPCSRRQEILGGKGRGAWGAGQAGGAGRSRAPEGARPQPAREQTELALPLFAVRESNFFQVGQRFLRTA